MVTRKKPVKKPAKKPVKKPVKTAKSSTSRKKKAPAIEVHPPKTDDELKQLAKDLYTDKIFTDRHFRDPEEAARMAPMVFMILNFLGPMERAVWAKDLGLIYEYYSAATTGRSVNGYPIFFSARTLTKDETTRMFEFYNKIKAAMDGV